MRDTEHGTYKGYAWHRRNEDPPNPCAACREAYRIYFASYRARKPMARYRNDRANAARVRALWRLSKMYPRDFRRLVNEELKVWRRPVESD